MDKFKRWLAQIRKQYSFGPLTKKFDDEGKLHCDDGPAYISPFRVIYYQHGQRHGPTADIFGTVDYYYENIAVPKEFILSPETIKPEEIINHPNMEIRYAGMKLVGFERLLSIAKIVHEDKEIDSVLLRFDGIFSEPLYVVKVVNATPEPDGTRKNYYLTVPPTVRTCKEAIAWTFRKTEKTYHPEVET